MDLKLRWRFGLLFVAAILSILSGAVLNGGALAQSAVDFVESPDSPGTTGRDTQFTLAPGVRAARNLGENRQIVVGAAAPITWSSGDTVRAVFIYFSFEGPMKGLQGRK